MLHALLVSLLIVGQTPPMDGEQLMEVLRGLHAGIQDFQLVCEGRVECPAADSEAERQKWESRFQGTYAYRAADGAAYLDLYTKRASSEASFLRKTCASVKAKRFESTLSSDQKHLAFGPVEGVGAPRVFTGIGSPERFIYINLWLQMSYSFHRYGYLFKGWEDVDGHPAVHVIVDENPKSVEANKFTSHYWIDLGRGGHVIKKEFYQGAKMWYRLHEVRLALVPAGRGKEVWFPLQATMDTFLRGTEILQTPVFHEIYYVVSGTLVLNQGLGDERFSINWKGPVARSEAFDRIARDYRASPSRPIAVPRTDPVGVMEDQKRRLAEADRQARQLDASPSSDRGWDHGRIVQYGAAILGAGSLIFAYFIRRARR